MYWLTGYEWICLLVSPEDFKARAGRGIKLECESAEIIAILPIDHSRGSGKLSRQFEAVLAALPPLPHLPSLQSPPTFPLTKVLRYDNLPYHGYEHHGKVAGIFTEWCHRTHEPLGHTVVTRERGLITYLFCVLVLHHPPAKEYSRPRLSKKVNHR